MGSIAQIVSFLKVKKLEKKKLVREKACNENISRADRGGGCKDLNVLNAKCLFSSSFKFKQLLCEFHLNKEKIPEQAGWAWSPGLAFGIKVRSTQMCGLGRLPRRGEKSNFSFL